MPSTDLFPAYGTSVLATAAGDATIYTPQAGKRIRVVWVYCGTPSSNTADVIVALRLGAAAPFYTFPLSAPGIFSHRTNRLGAVNAPLIANLSATQNVYLNVDVEEVA